LILFPALGFFAAWIANRTLGDGKRTPGKIFTHLAYMFLPVGLAMHLAHNVSHLVSEGPGIVPALQRTVMRYSSIELGAPDWQFVPLMSADSVYWLEMLLILLGFICSLVAGHRLAIAFFDRHANTGKALIPFVVLSLIFTVVNFYLLNQPMGARH
jgi:hypothetical protein